MGDFQWGGGRHKGRQFHISFLLGDPDPDRPCQAAAILQLLYNNAFNIMLSSVFSEEDAEEELP